MHRSRAVAAAGTLAAGGTLLMPVVRLPGIGSLNGIEAEAWPVLLLLVPAAVLLVLGDLGEPPLLPQAAAAAILAAAAVVYSCFKTADAYSAAAAATGSVAPGAWTAPATALLVVGGALLGISRRA